MTLISSQTLKESQRMTDKIAEEDITEVNALGQTVVVVPKGQPVPEGVDAPAQDKAAPKTQDKARRSSRQKAQEG